MRLARNSIAGTVLAALAVTGCRGSIAPFGESPELARYAADHAFAGFAYRFYNVARDSQFQRARTLMGQHALVPSRLFRDSTLWIRFGDSTRTLLVRGDFTPDGYRFTADPAPPEPGNLGQERHTLDLRWHGGGDYEWDLFVEHAIGPATPAAIAAAILATLTAAEGRAADAALTDARRAFPRTGAVLGLLFDIDSLRTTTSDGATAISLGLSFHPDRLRPRYPRLAAYVDKYVMPTVYSGSLRGPDSTTFVELVGRDGWLVIRVRSRDHRLVALEGPPVPAPDSLLLHANLSMKYGIFRVGFTDLVADFVTERGPRYRAWATRFRNEPAWHFPLAIDKLISTPLRRPFEGDGIEFLLGVRGGSGEQTQSIRHTRLKVNESAIMRWLGRLGGTAFGEFTGATEIEENRLLYEMFAALREDVAQI